MRINSGLHGLESAGVIRPQDIRSDNTVPHDQMAKERTSYGVQGQLTDVQTPRYGQQVLEQVSRSDPVPAKTDAGSTPAFPAGAYMKSA